MEELTRAAMEALGHEIFICSLKFFFSPRFHHAECIMLINQAGVEASHHNNTNIHICLLVYKFLSDMQSRLQCSYKANYVICETNGCTISNILCAYLDLIYPPSSWLFSSLQPFSSSLYILSVKMFTFQVFHFSSTTCLATLSFHH